MNHPGLTEYLQSLPPAFPARDVGSIAAECAETAQDGTPVLWNDGALWLRIAPTFSGAWNCSATFKLPGRAYTHDRAEWRLPAISTRMTARDKPAALRRALERLQADTLAAVRRLDACEYLHQTGGRRAGGPAYADLSFADVVHQLNNRRA